MTLAEILQVVVKDAKLLDIDFEEDIIDYRQINHYDDFHSLEPGYHWMRTKQITSIEGLHLAGDYTMKPYFATMEGAVVSGQKEARAILSSEKR